jgi:class 3 adenylate cyclase/TolB-like protein
MTQTRQLAAIMFTDIAGYTALMGNNEQKAFELLKKNRELQKPIIEQYNGRWIKELGDGVMASFNTVSDAVNAAIKIQETCNATRDFQLSIGIHQGEIIFENNDIYGDAVNIASRIQSLGVPGSVLFSKKITDEIRNKSEFQLTSLGSFEFKNVEEPIEVFALSNPAFVVPRREDLRGKLKTLPKQKSKKGIVIFAAAAVVIFSVLFILKDSIFSKKAAATTIKSLAILPFENSQDDSTLFFLSDGIPENLINRLSAYPEVKVFARSATFGLADTARGIVSLRKLLNADLVLTGRLQKKNNAYFLNCELVDAVSQSLRWGDTYELTNDDISSVEDSIVISLMNSLQIALVNNGNAVQKNKELNSAAYAEYLKGRYLSYGSTPEESEKALSHFREAIRIDPKYAAAYAAISNEKIVQGLFSTAPKKEIVDEARTAIEAAKALDPGLADIYTSEGAIKFYYDWDWKGAINSYKKALELDPGNSTIYIRYSTTLADLGRHKEALPLADKAVELDPVSISSLHNLGWVNLLAGNYKKSSEAFGKALELHPNWVWGYIKKSYGHIFLKEYDKALSLAESGEKLFKDGWGSELLQTQLCFIYQNCNQKEKADTVINRFLKYAAENTVKDPFTLSLIYYMKGDNKKANQWEEKTMQGRFPSAYLMSIPFLYDKEYFDGEAHQQILIKMGFVK